MSPKARWRARARDERGAATAVTVVVMPTVLLLVMLLVQYALAFHAKQITIAAAQDGLRAAQSDQHAGHGGDTAARRTLRSTSRDLMHDTSVRVTRRGDTVEVTATGTVTRLVPFLPLGVSGHAAGPVERFHPANEQQHGDGP